MSNACLQCGACCATWTVDFAREEWAGAGGAVPEGLAEQITAHTCRRAAPRSAAPSA
jgi:hypothetical protein